MAPNLYTETYYKRRLRNIIGGWSESYEPGQGSGVGYPDLQFHIPGYGLLPVETKCGLIRKYGPIHKLKLTTSLRPSQISWHDSYLKSGGISFVFVCLGDLVGVNIWSTPLPFRTETATWLQGWDVSKCKQVISEGNLVKDLSSLVAEAKEELLLRNSKNNLGK